MALSIGSVNFGVDAQTAGLQKAISQLQRFQRVVDQTARSQTAGAQKAADALGRQESAIKRAFQQTLNLRRALTDAGAKPEQIAQVSIAFNRLTKEMTSGKLTAVEFGRAMDAFNTRMGRTRRVLGDLKAEQAGKQMGRLTEIMRDLESASVLAVGPLSGLGARIRSLGAIAGRSGFQLVVLFGAIAAVTVGFSKLVAGAIRAERIFEQLEARFTAMGGSSAQAAAQLDFVIQTSRQLGLRIEDTAAAYSRLTAATAGTVLEGERTREIFLGIAKAAAALRLEAADVEGIFRAVEQMISKGQVTAEELRGQLGERLPGAFAMFARAMGLVDNATGSATAQLNRLIQAGEVGYEEILQFARGLDETFGQAAAENVNSFQGAVNRLSNAVLLFNQKFNETFRIGDIVAGALNAISDVVEYLTRNMKTLGIVLGTVVGAFVGLTSAAILSGLVKITRTAYALAVTMGAAAAGTKDVVKGWAGLVKIALSVGGALAGAELMRRSLADIDEMLDELEGGGGAFPANLTDAFFQVRDALDDARASTNEMLRVMDTLGSTSADVFGAEGLFQAREIIRKLNDDELVALQAHLDSINTGGRTGDLEHDLSLVMAVTEEINDRWNKFKQAIEATPEALREFDTEMTNLHRRLEAFGRGPRAVQLADQQAAIARAEEQMRDRLEKTTLTMEEREKKLQDYVSLLQAVTTAEDKAHSASQDWAAAISRGIEDMIFKANEFKDVLRALGEELLRIALRQLILAPLEQSISGGLGNLFGGPSITKRQYGGLSKGLTMVGEDGPELLNLGSTSRITPMSQMGGITQEIHLHFDVGLESVDTRIAQAAPAVAKAARDAVMTTLYRPAHA